MDKLRAVSLVQLKVLLKYENLLTIVMSQTWGNEPRNLFCKSKVLEHIDVIEKIIKEGQEKGDFFECNSTLMASEIFSLTCSTLLYLRKTGETLDVQKLYKEYEKTLFEKLERYEGE
jgi:hypothetical protein